MLWKMSIKTERNELQISKTRILLKIGQGKHVTYLNWEMYLFKKKTRTCWICWQHVLKRSGQRATKNCKSKGGNKKKQLEVNWIRSGTRLGVTEADRFHQPVKKKFNNLIITFLSVRLWIFHHLKHHNYHQISPKGEYSLNLCVGHGWKSILDRLTNTSRNDCLWTQITMPSTNVG